MNKLIFLFRLQTIHNSNFIHRDFHSGNILLVNQGWKIGDFGLSQPANKTLSNNEIYYLSYERKKKIQSENEINKNQLIN